METNWVKGFLLALWTSVLWGVLPVFMKLIVSQLNSPSIVWIRLSFAAVVLGAFQLLRRSYPRRAAFTPRVIALLGLGTIFMVGNFTLFVDSLIYISPGNAQLFIQLGPVFLAFGAIVFFKERFNTKQWLGQLGLAIGFLLFFADQIAQFPENLRQYFTGVILVTAAALTWAGYALVQKALQGSLKASQILFCFYGGCSLALLPFINLEPLYSLNAIGWIALTFCCLNTIFGYGAFAEALRHWHASRVSAVLAITPVITFFATRTAHMLLPQYFKNEAIDVKGMLGAILVVICSAIVALSRQRKSP